MPELKPEGNKQDQDFLESLRLKVTEQGQFTWTFGPPNSPSFKVGYFYTGDHIAVMFEMNEDAHDIFKKLLGDDKRFISIFNKSNERWRLYWTPDQKIQDEFKHAFKKENPKQKKRRQNGEPPPNSIPYHIDNLPGRFIERDQRKPKIITTDDLRRLLDEPGIPDRLVFYTGAGISQGAVPSMKEIEDQALIKSINYGDLDYDEIFKKLSDNLEFLEDFYNAGVNFFNRLFDVSPSTLSKSHRHFTSLVGQTEPLAVITENLDLKHQTAGFYYGVDELVKIIRAPERVDSQMRLKQLAESLNESPDKPKYLVTIGLSRDDRSFIEYLKRNVSDLVVIAIEKDKKYIPSFLGEEDMLIRGDAEDVLKELLHTSK